MPSFAEAKDKIVEIVTAQQGMKATDLVAYLPKEMLIFEISALVDELVAAGRLVEVEYSLPNLDFRLKSFLLPPQTKVRLLGGISL